MAGFQNSLEAKEDFIQQILGNHTVFYAIPPYQRPYSWKEEQVEQLWDDLAAWLDSGSGSLDRLPPYFLGSVVLTDNDGVWEIIDGQQRLTTISLLIAAARQLADEKVRRHLDKYLEGEADPFKDEPARLRLTARQRDNDFWAGQIIRQTELYSSLAEDGNLEDPQKNMLRNARWLSRKIGELSSERRNILVQAVLKHCFLVVVKTRDTSTAMRIFQVLNDRGLDLRATDILKAAFIGKLPAGERPRWTQTWEDAEANLGRDGLETLFSHLRLLMRRRRQESTLIKEMEQVASEVGVSNFFEKHLAPAIPAYRIIREREYEAAANSEAVNDHLTALSLLDNRDWEPIALELVKSLRHDSSTLASSMRWLEGRAYWSLLRRDSTHGRVTRYLEVIQAGQLNGITGLVAALRLSSDEGDELKRMLDGAVYTEARARRPILLLLNRLVSDDNVWMIHPNVTVEHVLPQNPSDGSEWWSWFSPDTHERWIHRLGNLLLLSRRRNTSASNLHFDEKKRKYFLTKGTSPYPLTSQVLAEADWTESTLRRRHERLKRMLVERWGIPV